MKRLSTLLTALIGITVVILSVSCGEGAETEQVAQPAAQPQQSDPPDQPAVEQTAEQQSAAATEQIDEQQQSDEEQVEAAPPPNRAPVASAGSDGRYDLSAGLVLLDGSSSRDPDGDSLTFEWTQISGPTVSLRQASDNSSEARFDSPRTEQTLVFQLRVTDESGAASEDTVTLAFVNAPPTAAAGSDQGVGRGQDVVLNGRGSDDAGGVLSYNWSQISGPPVELSDAAAVTPSFTAPNEFGALVFSLTVSDGEHESAADSVTITVRNLPPVADAGSNQTVAHSTRVVMDGSESADGDGDGITYEWTQVGGEEVSLSNTAVASPTFTAPQRAQHLRFRLTVSDGMNAAEPSEVVITVRNERPIAQAGSMQKVRTGAWITLDGRESADPEGNRLTYRWTQSAGDAVSLNDPAAARPSFTAPQKAQTLRFRLEVSDGNESATDTVRIVVEYEPVVASNFEAANRRTTLIYEAKEDAFTGDVRTDVRMRGPQENLMIDVVCFENGSAAIGFRLLNFVRPERDADVPRDLEVMWRLNDGLVRRQTLDVTFLGETPAVYFQNAGGGFNADWPQVLIGGSLAVRISYRGVQEEVFDLDAFARTPVHRNLVNCGSY